MTSKTSLPSSHKVIRLAHRPKTHIDPPSHFLPLTYEPRPELPLRRSSPSSSTSSREEPPLVLVHRLYLSLEPAMRGWMSAAKSYLPPVGIGDVMRGVTLSEVVATQESPVRGPAEKRLQVGDIVSEFSDDVGGWQEFAVVSERSVRKLESLSDLLMGSAGSAPPPKTIKSLPLTAHLSILGTTGLTAYFGLIDIGRPRTGYLASSVGESVSKSSSSDSSPKQETILVTAAAGAVGSVVCQIAKNIYGCKVIGVAGGEAKCRWLRHDLGCCDETIDYRAMEARVIREFDRGDKNEDDERGAMGGKINREKALRERKSKEFRLLLRNALKQIGSNGFDIMFDNVGGYQLNEPLSLLNTHARVVLCGAISAYNDDVKSYPSSLYMKHGMTLIGLRAKIEGFIVLDYIRRWGEAKCQLAKWIVEGKIRYKEDVREGGLDVAPRALLDLFYGKNQGKLIVKVGERLMGGEEGGGGRFDENSDWKRSKL